MNESEQIDEANGIGQMEKEKKKVLVVEEPFKEFRVGG